MATCKVSVSFRSELAERVRRAAEQEGVSISAWLSDAAEQKAAAAEKLAEARAALDELIETYGEPDAETARAAEQELEAVGFWEPETPEHAAMRRAALASLFEQSDEPQQRVSG